MNSKLELLQKNNSSIIIKEETEHINIENLWGDDSFMLRYPNETNFSEFEDIEFPIELSAIYHKTSKRLELIYAPLNDNHDHLNRKTTYYYKGIEFKTEFGEPSPQLVLISKGFKELDLPGESNYRNLRQFRDFYREDQQTSQMKAYFKDKKPYSFFIEGDFKKIKNELVTFCKHLNVYIRFFDRKAPIINIINIEPKIDDDFNVPCKTNEFAYPEIIATQEIDQVALDLLNIATETGNPRLKYLFHYQIIEYFAYYYLDEELKRKFSNLLKSPDILHNYSNYSKIIIEELKDYTNNTSDKQKLTKLINDYITVDDIQEDIRCNINYFTQDVEFDGKFKLPALVNDDKIFDKIKTESKETREKKKEKDKLRQDLINQIADRIEKIRNVLVHIRESRENKVIFPTRNNNRKLLPYLFLLRRISETIAMKYNV